MSRQSELAELSRIYDSSALSNRNLIINGEFFVSQRGDYSSVTSASTGTYYMDRWAVDFTGVTATVQNQSTDLPNGVTAKTFKLAATSSATGYLQIRQKIEPASYMDNRQVTVSAYVRSNSSLPRLRIEGAGASSTNIDGTQTHTGGGDWEKLTFTTTLKDGITAFTVGCILWNGSTTSISSGEYVEISQFQVEFGNTATPFEHRSYGDELARCQRYFYRTARGTTGSVDDAYIGIGRAGNTSNSSETFFSHPVFMRASPTVTFDGNIIANDGSALTSSGINTLEVGVRGGYIQGTGHASGLTTNDAIRTYFQNDGEGMNVDAEL